MHNWKPVVGYESDYIVSSDGIVFSKKNNMILSQYVMNKGYKTVSLSKNKISKRFLVHRIVAQAFIHNPDKLPQVNHKDGDKTNNDVSNLEWVTNSENQKHRVYVLNSKPSKSMKVVYQVSLSTGETINRFRSIAEAARCTGIGKSSIYMAARGKHKTAHGYKWKSEII